MTKHFNFEFEHATAAAVFERLEANRAEEAITIEQALQRVLSV